MIHKECQRCGLKVKKLKYLHKLGKEYFCRKCVKEKREEHWGKLKENVGNKFDKEKEEEDIVKKRIKERSAEPNMNHLKRIGEKISAKGNYLTSNEKLVVYKKLVREGVEPTVASDRVKNLCNAMRELKAKLSLEVKDKKDLKERFQEEFAKLIDGDRE